MQNTRSKAIVQLEELFKFASAFAKGDVKFTYDGGRREGVTLDRSPNIGL